MISAQQEKIIRGEICPYCYQIPEKVSSVEIYGTDYGDIMICRACNAYVGCHKDTNLPKGRLANAHLRVSKIIAHGAFDQLWKEKAIIQLLPIIEINELGFRKASYKFLARELHLDEQYCHIGMFDTELCEETYKIVKYALKGHFKDFWIGARKKPIYLRELSIDHLMNIQNMLTNEKWKERFWYMILIDGVQTEIKSR